MGCLNVFHIEPTLRLLNKTIIFDSLEKTKEKTMLFCKTNCGIDISFCSSGISSTPIVISCFTDNEKIDIEFKDAFNSHKNGLIVFLNIVKKTNDHKVLSRDQIFNNISLIEKGI